ncbi:DUF2334 domain-containing protein [Phenylobacterium sp.]|uniref:DUF2334 domain-containing protein n=1 Tax=Phenylobacterium sp. TaxID=1871053 RepID=UPI002C1B0142|nr:DUF2334 domain-containing protein [Phenylobacterium sp.]HLZ75499.1 DUF2334 domain-containing protein [Phenylobacterium sp.]
MTTRIFLRDDDVGALTPALTSFVGRFAARGLPVSYQIIPEQFTPEAAAFMLAERAKAPNLIEFGQHGLRHEMQVRGKTEYYEFGPERTYAQQLADIEQGKALLQARLGAGEALRVFTPPRHRYDRNTLKAIRATGFSVLSASSYATPKHRAAYAVGRALGLTNLGRPGVPWHERVRPDCGLFELSVAVGIDDGDYIVGSADDVMAEIGRSRRHMSALGVLFHHQVFAQPDGEAHLDAVLDGLQRLPDVTFHTLGDLYDHRAEAGRT